MPLADVQQNGSSSPPPLQQWLDRLTAVADRARATLATIKPTKLALYSGCTIDADGHFRLTFFGQEYIVTAGDFAVRNAHTGSDASPFTRCLLLTYLATADGTTPSGRWVSFRELPGGLFYAQAFQGYTGDRLARALPVNPEAAMRALRQAAEHLHGETLAIGDVGYTFTVLPRIRLGIVYWAGDEEFAPRAQVIFEDTSAHYLPVDGLAIVGSQLVDRILAVGSDDRNV